MSANPQWDISRALGVARLFHLVCGVRDACVTPFLTLYLRQLGLAAPWVGILMGTKHLIAAGWGPFCAFLAKSYQRRRLLLTGSLLGSAGASLLMVLVPLLNKDLVYRSCNGSSSSTTPVVPAGVALTVNITLVQESAAHHPAGAPDPPARSEGAAPEASGLGNGPGEGDQETVSRLPRSPVGSDGGTGTGVLHAVRSGVEASSWSLALGRPSNLSEAKGEARALDLSLQGLRWTFILTLVAVVFWELLAAPLEQVADDSLYEYLDFVDATDRYGSLGVWRLLGLVAGVCGIAALVGQLGCFRMTNAPWGVVYFYGYSLVSTLASLVSLSFPVPNYQRQEPGYKTAKALSLVGGDPRLVLLALTVFVVGAVVSNVQNFLFWHMEDHGSSELVMGFSVALGLLGEILLHPFRTPVLRKLSRAGTLGLGLGCLAGQTLYYSFLWSWWAVLPVQILSAVSSQALWWASGAFIQDLASPGTERPLGTMFRGHFYGGGCSLGGLVGGFVTMRFGLAVLFRACCVGLVLWLAAFLSVQLRLPQERKINYSKLLAVEGSDGSDSELGSERDWLVKAMREDHSDWRG